MMKPVTGQYECVRKSPVGLDYFTGRVDRLTLQGDGRFILITQEHARLVNAAQSLLSGQQVNQQPPETRHEGRYLCQDRLLILQCDDGSRLEGQFSWNGEGVQIGKDFFSKVSDSTLFPPPQRLKKDMEDIARGLKIAATLGGLAVKAAKTLQETVQTPPSSGASSAAPPAPAPAPVPSAAAPPGAAMQPPPPGQPPAAVPRPAPQPVPPEAETLFCDQCGARARPGKRYCNQCGALLP
jgi:hypothetical protein